MKKTKFNTAQALMDSSIDVDAELPRTFSPQCRTQKAMQFGKWKVSRSGDMSHDNGRYIIYNDQLRDNDWIAHMFEKSWINWNEFIPAYFQALTNAGIHQKRELVFY